MEILFKRNKLSNSEFPSRVAPGEPLWFKDKLYIGSVGTSIRGTQQTAGTPVLVSAPEHVTASGSIASSKSMTEFFSGDLLSTYLTLDASSATASSALTVNWMPIQTAYVLLSNNSAASKTVRIVPNSAVASAFAVSDDDLVSKSGSAAIVTIPSSSCVEVSLMLAGQTLVITHSAEMEITSIV